MPKNYDKSDLKLHMRSTLQEAAILVRSKLEKAKYDVDFQSGLKWFTMVEYFPSGCCKQTSFVFLYYVMKHLKIDPKLLFFVANAEITPDRSHAWAKVGDFHVDLTGDQFGGGEVIVSDSDPWLNRHSRGCEYPFHVEELSERVRATLERLFHYICDCA